MASQDDVDLAPSRTEGYNLTEKKTVAEYTALDAKFYPSTRVETNRKR
jgi:hypothetical protein